MSKKAIYYDEGKRLYVQNGIALDTIEDMLSGNVTRRTLHNWKTEGRWDEKRKRYIEEQQDLGDMVLEIAKTVAQNALADPSPKNLLSLARALNALKEKDALAMLAGGKGGDDAEDQENVSDAIQKAIKDVMGA